MKLNHGLLGGILGAVGGGLVSSLFGNAQNKANQANAQNQQTGAEQFQAAQLQKMIDFIKSQQAAAQGNLTDYLNKHPMPTANLPPIALPNFNNTPSVIGGEQLGANGQLTNALSNTPEQLVNPAIPQYMGNANANVSLLDTLMPMLMAMAPQQPPIPNAAAPSPSAPSNFPRPNPHIGERVNRFANL